ncbi:Alpha/beta hydrolase family protein [Amycolatopsis arida]|uniref:Alpha/beta hydrolase family protein n=1 Tax=Amycolatopsis arida TaxID=587909 RepID=A0A1I5LQ56_9PSEU|nr:alpha/beta hydrolase [Amycolatopsis arida]TDX93803.1 alpha/beta hydrolase family protein [Amycolatopsis arida]SFO99504.1 Alpha/beta hydrolase family protein [Amycolatopsis arida]
MSRVTSKDGTPIAYERQGSGPAVVLVTGALDDGSENAPLATELAGSFTVFNYARRGRGASGDTPPYAVAREIEDLAALIGAAGGPVRLYGVSTGGALALEAVAAGLPVDRIAVYELPYSLDAPPGHWRDYVVRLRETLAEGRRGDALELFMRLAGSSDEDIVAARTSPMWPDLETLAHTLAYDAAVLGDSRPPFARLAAITQPALVATGGGADFFERGGLLRAGRGRRRREPSPRGATHPGRPAARRRPGGAGPGARPVLHHLTEPVTRSCRTARSGTRAGRRPCRPCPARSR